MNPNFDEDQTRQISSINPSQTVQPAQSSGGLMDYIRNHKLLFVILVILVAFLIWWFFFRNKKNLTGTASNGSVNVPNNNSVKNNLIKNRNGQFY
ncbi:hypothetical protein QLL95_gp0810 [Cotonvirus japonicus]|uniref:Uncharacterized protein n=1 Tax=Cotonvirus japonicus TaxID=2811091 RepID=A0ABM7NT34_9VIRU|nr:hypothetical protein QLL95_gp0810 [Cotonvirus japonicus]BCS83313.1 hypothetical protein [Cotonvirus japonicus]